MRFSQFSGIRPRVGKTAPKLQEEGQGMQVRRKCLPVPLPCCASRRNDTLERGSVEAVCLLRPEPWSYSRVFFTPNPGTGTEHPEETVQLCHPAIPKWTGTKLPRVRWKVQVTSSAYISFLLKQCSIDLRRSSKGMNLVDMLLLISYFKKEMNSPGWCDSVD